ncbi:MAG: carboxypeptidase regulatory-like domain-containing protein, partial [Acidobacteria bacterium]|nr:carboxypeptidase regulatory-like domain-containing protein [Acidobacteriota bacterium]
MTNLTWSKRALLFGLAVFMLSGFLFAQGGLTAVRGVVKDATGAVIPGVEVTVTDAATGASRTVITDEAGVYLVSQLQPGTYNIRAELAGFKARQANGIALRVNETITFNIDLEVGAVSDVIEVVAAADAVSTVDAKLGVGFDQKKILDLPLNARNIVGLLGLQAGVNINLQDGGQVNGARPDQQNIVLDGVNINRQEQGSAMQGALPTTLDSVQEFIVQTAGTDASSGRGSGGQVQLVTRRGSNEWHGSAYWFYRTNGTSAADYFAQRDSRTGKPQVTPLIRNIPGGSIGGPVLKDKLFIFGAYERRTDRSGSLVTRNVPTPELLNGQLRYRRTDGTFGTITTGCGSMLEAWSGIPCDTWNPALVGPNGLWERYRPFSEEAAARLRAGDNSVRGGDQGANILRYAFNAPDVENTNIYISRIDYTLNSKNTVFVRGTVNDTVETNSAETFPGFNNSRDRIDNSKGFAANWNWVITPTLNSNLTGGLTREAFEVTGLAVESYSPLFTNLVQTGGSSKQAINTWNIVEQLSWVKGKHNLQGGFNIRLIDNNVNSFAAVQLPNYGNAANLTGNNIGVASSPGLRRAVGDAEFTRVGSAQNVGDAVLSATGSVSRFAEDVQYDISGRRLTAGSPFVRKIQLWEYEFYAQDSWRFTPNVTVNAGLNYMLQTPPYEANGVQVNWVEDLGARWRESHDTTRNTSTMPLLTTVPAGRGNGKPDYYKTDKNNFAPRISAAWTPRATDGFFGFLANKGGQLVVRGGYSLSFDGMGRTFGRDAAQSGSIGLKTSFAIPGFAYSFDGLEGIPRAPRVSGGASGLILPRSVFPVAPAASDFRLPVSTASNAGCSVACGVGAVSTIAIDPSLR